MGSTTSLRFGALWPSHFYLPVRPGGLWHAGEDPPAGKDLPPRCANAGASTETIYVQQLQRLCWTSLRLRLCEWRQMLEVVPPHPCVMSSPITWLALLLRLLTAGGRLHRCEDAAQDQRPCGDQGCRRANFPQVPLDICPTILPDPLAVWVVHVEFIMKTRQRKPFWLPQGYHATTLVQKLAKHALVHLMVTHRAHNNFSVRLSEAGHGTSTAAQQASSD